MSETDEVFDEDEQVCKCGHAFFRHAGKAFNYSCCVLRCECKSFTADDLPSHPETRT